MNKILLVIIGILLVGSGYLAYRLYFSKPVTNSDAVSTNETKEIIKKVGEHMVLPDNETPTVATVTDPAVLKDQPFFAKAQVGYKVLIYAQSKKAILYDPVNDKIVEVGPINTETNASSTTP